MPSLKNLKAKADNPFHKGDMVTISDEMGTIFTVKVVDFTFGKIHTVNNIVYLGMNMGKTISIVDSGFVIKKVNGINFDYDSFFLNIRK